MNQRNVFSGTLKSAQIHVFILTALLSICKVALIFETLFIKKHTFS